MIKDTLLGATMIVSAYLELKSKDLRYDRPKQTAVVPENEITRFRP